MESLPCPQEMIGECRVFQTEGHCRQDIHHEYWPKNEYTTATEKEFRELEINKRFICRALHNAIHAANRASDHPSRAVMIETIKDQDEAKNNARNGRDIHRAR